MHTSLLSCAQSLGLKAPLGLGKGSVFLCASSKCLELCPALGLGCSAGPPTSLGPKASLRHW